MHFEPEYHFVDSAQIYFHSLEVQFPSQNSKLPASDNI